LSQGIVPDDIKREQELIAWADHLVFIYPIWWFERPALLKGWIDRVFTNGFAFSYGNGVKGLLKHKKALVVQTAGNTEAELQKDNIIEIIQRPMTEGTLQYCGIADVRVRTFAAVAKGAPNQSEVMMTEIRDVLLKDW
jgi:NAD(P)H dehydrogenase (quinone)